MEGKDRGAEDTLLGQGDWDIRVYTVLTEDATADGQVKRMQLRGFPGLMAESQGLAADSDAGKNPPPVVTGDRIDISLPFRFRNCRRRMAAVIQHCFWAIYPGCIK